MDSDDLQTFIQDVRDDLNNLDDLINYYDFIGHHNIRSIVFNPENDSSFFEGSVVTILDRDTVSSFEVNSIAKLMNLHE